MRAITVLDLFIIWALAPAVLIRAQVVTDVVYVTIDPSADPSSSTSTATASSITPAYTVASAINGASSTLATIITSSPQSHFTSSSTSVTAQAEAASTGTSTSGDGSESSSAGDSGSGTAVDTDAGASGSSGDSFGLSNGALAAIIVVVVLVALIGVASVILYVVAKRRQWNIRASIARASRRFTGRGPRTPRTATTDRFSKRAGVRLNSPPRPGVKAVYPPGHKRAVVAGERDVEKQPHQLQGHAPPNTRSRENTWVEKLWGNDWK